MRPASIVILLMLMASTAMAVDVRREAYHSITDDLKDAVTFTDYFYGMWANGTLQLLQNYEDQFGFIQGRVAGVDIDYLSVHSTGNVLITNITGVYPDFVVHTDEEYKIGGKGFTDDLCTSRTIRTIGPIEQEFMFYISIPQKLLITKVPEDASGNLTHISYRHTAKFSNGVAYEYLYFRVKDATDIDTYCSEREQVDAVLKQGFIAEDKWIMGPGNSAVLVLVAALLGTSLLYLIRSK